MSERYYPDPAPNPVAQLREELRRLDCRDIRHAADIGRTAVLKGEDPRRIAASIRRNQPKLFR